MILLIVVQRLSILVLLAVLLVANVEISFMRMFGIIYYGASLTGWYGLMEGLSLFDVQCEAIRSIEEAQTGHGRGFICLVISLRLLQPASDGQPIFLRWDRPGLWFWYSPSFGGDLPFISVSAGGVVVPYLFDPGSVVSTITESFFCKHFLHLGLKAAKRLAIQYIGYIELDMVVLGLSILRMGILLVKDPENVTL